MSVTLARSLPELEALREAWDSLACRAASPLLDHDWFVSCAATLHAEASLRVAVALDGGTVTAIGPLALEQTVAGARLTLLGASTLFEPSGWLFTTAQDIELMVPFLTRLGHPIVLQRVPAESLLCSVLPEVARGRAITAVRPGAPTLGVNTRGSSWDEYYAGLSTRVTVNLPRLRRRAERVLGTMTFTTSAPLETEVDEALEALVTVEGSGWKGRRGSALGSRPELRRFFQHYCHRSAAARRLRVSRLAFGSHLVAMELAVEAYGRLWQLKIGYSEPAAEYYPGLHLVQASIRATFDQGLASYEFLGSAEAWEARWRPEVRNYSVVAAYPFSVRGVIGGCRDFAGAMWRRANRSATQVVNG